MSEQAIWERVRMAWAMVAGPRRVVAAGRLREVPAPPAGDEPALAADGFVEEALPWLDAVFRFALRLTRGDQPNAEDLVQETFLRAHRYWHTFARGTNVKSWLFTICRHAHAQDQRRRARRPEGSAVPLEDAVTEGPVHGGPAGGAAPPDPEMLRGLLDEEVVRAIDALPDAFRDVLVLSDIGDLQYQEIAQVLDLPLGTVRSRLFRARRILQDRLRDYAQETGRLPRQRVEDPSA